AIVGLQVQDAGVWITRMDVSPETVRDIDHEQRQIRRIGDPGGGDVHEVFQAPVLFGIPEVQLNLEPSPIIVYEGRVRQVQVTAEQDDMGAGLGVQVRLRNDDDMQRLRAFLGEQLRLGEAGLDVPVHGGVVEIRLWEVVVINLAAIRATGTAPSRGAGGGEGQGCITPQLGNEVQVALPHPMQGVVVAKVAIEHQRGHREHGGDQAQQ